MARWLLDANIISHAVRDPRGDLAARIASTAEDQICTSIVVVGELRYGLRKKNSAKLTASVEAVLSGLTIEPLAEPAADIYAGIVAKLEAEGRMIGANDLWIAAHALALECTLVTDDGDFHRIAGLPVDNWFRP
jgi:tRNA(fMet)-specific endonuclease VapC